jgi:hypothetical protein
LDNQLLAPWALNSMPQHLKVNNFEIFWLITFWVTIIERKESYKRPNNALNFLWQNKFYEVAYNFFSVDDCYPKCYESKNLKIIHFEILRHRIESSWSKQFIIQSITETFAFEHFIMKHPIYRFMIFRCNLDGSAMQQYNLSKRFSVIIQWGVVLM